MGAEATMSVSEGQHGKQLHGTGDRKQIMSTFRGYYGGLSLPADECCVARCGSTPIWFGSTPLALPCSVSVRARPEMRSQLHARTRSTHDAGKSVPSYGSRSLQMRLSDDFSRSVAEVRVVKPQFMCERMSCFVRAKVYYLSA